MIRALFWDNDGVLVDTESLYYQATREFLSLAGVILTKALFKQISLTKGRSTFDLAAEKGVSQQEIDRLRKGRNRRYTQLLEGGVQIMEGVVETVGELRGNVIQGIVTSSRKEHFETMHRGTGLRACFDFILTHEDFTLSKPNPEPYLMALKQCGLAPKDCLVIEDSPRGIESALAAGIRCLVVPNNLTRGSDFTGAWRVLRNCREVPTEIRKLDGMPTGT
jgi:HAD superfamily hydrolase (TIGR01509 family)